MEDCESLSSFFEPPPPLPEPPPETPRPRWAGASDAEIGRAVALNLMLGRSDKAALWVSAATVYTDGFEFDVQIRHRLDEGLLDDPFSMYAYHSRRRSPEEGLDPGLLRLGIQFSDGRKATNLPGRMPFRGDSDGPPEGPILWSAGGGGGGGGRWYQGFWVWPLPPEGTLAFVCEWPLADISETRSEIDSSLLSEAAAEAAALWPEAEGGSHSGGWTTYETHRVPLPPAPPEAEEPTDPDDSTV
jgi:hypothetical protein